MRAFGIDSLARVVGDGTTRRGLLGLMMALLGGVPEAQARGGKRRRCDPACAAGQTCVRGTCACDDGGATCGATCCHDGQRCERGQCVARPNPTCVPAGVGCKGTGRACCDGRACASGQGGKGDVACYVPAGGSCATTAECVFGATCMDAVCIANPQPAPPPPITPTVCTPTIPTTGDPDVDGAALSAALLAANVPDEVVITLASGTYRLPATEPYVGICRDAGRVTVQGCEGVEVTITGAPEVINGQLFRIEGGAFTLRNVTLAGPAWVGVIGMNAGTQVVLDQVTVDGFDYGAWSDQSATVTIEGGAYSGASYGLYGGTGSWTCSGDPRVVSINNGAADRCGGPIIPPTSCGCQPE